MMDTKTAQAYRGYAKETMKRALAALRQRHAHLLAQNQLEEQSADEAKGNGMMRQAIVKDRSWRQTAK
jgi:hypothetical protein